MTGQKAQNEWDIKVSRGKGGERQTAVKCTQCYLMREREKGEREGDRENFIYHQHV